MANSRWVNESLEEAGILLFCVAGILLMPVWFPLACFFTWRYERRIRETAVNSRCAACGVVLGGESLRLADAEWGRFVDDLHRNHPGVRFRLVRTTHAICPNCGARYRLTPLAATSSGPSSRNGSAPTRRPRKENSSAAS